MDNPIVVTASGASPSPGRGVRGSTRANLRARPVTRISLALLAMLALFAVFAEMIASPLPLVGRIDGHFYVLPNVFSPSALNGKTREQIEADAAAVPSNGDWTFGPFVHYGPTEVAITKAGDSDVLASPSRAHPFGTDSLGRDVFARLIFGTRTEFGAALLAVTASLVVGIVLGALAGFLGGAIDAIVTRLVEALTAVPTLLLLLVVQALVGHPSLETLLLAYAATRWTEVARLVRVEVLRVTQQDFVLAARALGASPMRILWRHVAPNARSVILVAGTFGVAQLILTEAALDFLRVGAASNVPTWGEALAEARDHVEAWWLLLYPGLAIFVTLLVLHRIGDVLRDALDPRTARHS